MPSQAPPQQGPSSAAGRRATPMIPFDQASMHGMDNPVSLQVTPGAASQLLSPVDLTPNGFLRSTDIHVHTVTAATGSPVGSSTYPWCILQGIQFLDTGGQKMDDISGYQLFADNLVNGSPWVSDPRAAGDYSASATSPNFRLRLSRELFPNGEGSIPNLSGSQKYRVRFNFAALADIYTTAPTAAPTLQVDVIDHLWLLPQPSAGGIPQSRQPPRLGLAQYHKSIYPALSVDSSKVSQIVKMNGTLLKYLAVLGYDSTGAPSDAVFPDPFTLQLDNDYPFSDVPLSEIMHAWSAQVPGLVSRPPGVLFIPWNYGRTRHAGGPGVASLISTSTATFMKFSGSQPTPTNGTFDVMFAEVSTANVNPAERASMGSNTGVWQPAIPSTTPGGV